MKKLMMALLVASGLSLPAQDWGQHFGLNLYVVQPSDTAGKLYERGYKIAVPFYFRIGNRVEQRLRVEFGSFSEGPVRQVDSYGTTEKSSASSRLVGYDWLVSMGERKEAGVDLILGVGGTSWYQEITRTMPGNAPYKDTETQAAFAATLGLRVRFNRHIALELHQVLTSLPGEKRDFRDAELSHTALGIAFRL